METQGTAILAGESLTFHQPVPTHIDDQMHCSLEQAGYVSGFLNTR